MSSTICVKAIDDIVDLSVVLICGWLSGEIMVMVYKSYCCSYVIPEHNRPRWVNLHSCSSISINVVPTFGHIVNVSETDKNTTVYSHSFSSEPLKTGNLGTGPFTQCPRTLISPATPLFQSVKSSKNPSIKNTSTSMWNAPA